MRARALGHLYTIGSHLADRLRPPAVPAGEPWSTFVHDERLGDIELTGVHHVGVDPLVVLVHGLGGSIDSGYVRRMAAAACARGHGVLRLNLRGADRLGADIYHAGLTDDLAAALRAPTLAGYSERVVIGYSLGGHMSLRYAGGADSELAAVVAVCSPLDLAAGARHIDTPLRRVYRRHLLRGLREIFAMSAAHVGPIVGLAPADTRSITTMREWDERVVARRFGFEGADHYYASATALSVIDCIRARALMVRVEADPMISDDAAALDRVADHEVWRIGRAGHVGFPRSEALETRILDWVAEGLI